MNRLTRSEVRACAHSRERVRFATALIFSLLLLPFITIIALAGTLFMLLLPVIVGIIWMIREVVLANIKGNAVLVSELNYPRIYNITNDLKECLSVKQKVHVFVYEQGQFNASMASFFHRRAIFINSELIEQGVSDDEVRWIVGRFVGYLRRRKDAGLAGRVIKLAQIGMVFNFFILPYERALVYTGDRLALAAIGGNVSIGVSAIQKLLVGRMLGHSVNPIGLIDQHRQVSGSLFAFLARIGIGHPHMTARFVDLLVFSQYAYPDQFSRFSADNPGIPSDLRRLGSASRGLAPALGAMFGAVALVVAYLALSAPLNWAVTTGGRFAGMHGIPFGADLISPSDVSASPEAETAIPDTDFGAAPTPEAVAAAAAADWPELTPGLEDDIEAEPSPEAQSSTDEAAAVKPK